MSPSPLHPVVGERPHFWEKFFAVYSHGCCIDMKVRGCALAHQHCYNHQPCFPSCPPGSMPSSQPKALQHPSSMLPQFFFFKHISIVLKGFDLKASRHASQLPVFLVHFPEQTHSSDLSIFPSPTPPPPAPHPETFLPWPGFILNNTKYSHFGRGCFVGEEGENFRTTPDRVMAYSWFFAQGSRLVLIWGTYGESNLSWYGARKSALNSVYLSLALGWKPVHEGSRLKYLGPKLLHLGAFLSASSGGGGDGGRSYC